jgi:hypothetical protein
MRCLTSSWFILSPLFAQLYLRFVIEPVEPTEVLGGLELFTELLELFDVTDDFELLLLDDLLLELFMLGLVVGDGVGLEAGGDVDFDAGAGAGVDFGAVDVTGTFFDASDFVGGSSLRFVIVPSLTVVLGGVFVSTVVDLDGEVVVVAGLDEELPTFPLSPRFVIDPVDWTVAGGAAFFSSGVGVE